MRRLVLVTIIAVITSVTLASQDVDYNEYYRFPLSVEVEYQGLIPFADYASGFRVSDVSGTVRLPLPGLPVIQPLVQLGYTIFDSLDQAEPEKWDHFQFRGALGVGYSHRFERSFEVGAELLAGYAASYFPDLAAESGTVGQSNLLAEIGGRINLDPTYNLAISLHPSLKYLVSLGALRDFNGPILSIGVSLGYRFGDDPDSAAGLIRSLRVEEAPLSDLFASMHSYYADNPVTTVTLTNTDRFPVTDVEVSFDQAGYMDTPTPSAALPELAPGESVEVPLYALFNKEIFSLEGVTPLTGEVIISYASRGRPAEQRKSLTYSLHDKTALTWDDARKIAALVTPSDGALRNYASYIRQAAREAVIPGYSDALQFAVQAFYALDEIGCLYQADPASPFTEVQGDTLLVDSVSLPRDTLTRITGDCDDLTVLYNSLLETTGVETGFITTPGHIYSVVNTQVDAVDYAMVHPDRRMTMVIDDKIWVPVEITLIGLTSFTEAWKTGVEEWHKFENSVAQRAFYATRTSQQVFTPVSLTERDLGLQYGDPEAIRTQFTQELGVITGAIAEGFRSSMQDPPTKVGYNQLGILHAGFGQYELAEAAFQAALDVDPEFVGAKVNLGSLNFLLGNYDQARDQFAESYDQLKEDGRENSRLASQVLINLSGASEQLNETDQAADAYRLAAVANPEAVRDYETAGDVEETGTRASAVPDLSSQILFVND